LIHGIREADVANAPLFGEVWPQLWACVSGPLVAHNASFDISVLRHGLDRFGYSYPETDYFCTRVIARKTWPEHSTYALDYLAASLGISFEHHNALEDARACAQVAIAACKHFRVNSLYKLRKVCKFRIGKLFEDGYQPCGVPGAYAPSPKIQASEVPATGSIDIGHPFFGRSFVFTGQMISMQRNAACQAVIDRGGTYHSQVKKETDFLVLGQAGYIGYRGGHKSLKTKKAEQMRESGLPIEIISESDFKDML
jgi:DNA polymerase III subunit epsilon